MKRSERRVLERLADDLHDCAGGLASRLRPPAWWESAGFSHAMCALMPFGAGTVNRELARHASSS